MLDLRMTFAVAYNVGTDSVVGIMRGLLMPFGGWFTAFMHGKRAAMCATTRYLVGN